MTSISTFKQWESPEKTRISGEPPGPDVTVSQTQRGEFRRQDVRAINPLYKTGPVTNLTNGSGVGIRVNRESKIEPSYYETPDYKVEREQESYKLQIIDPKVSSHTTPFYSSTLPASFRKEKTPDFPSAHSKRSFLKLSPLEPRRIRSMETKSITPHDYLSESLERHRNLSMSPLRENLRVHERDINQPWNAARRPGPKDRDPLKDITSLKATVPTTRPSSQSTNAASWQFTSGGAFSPKSVISVNGHQRSDSAPGLLKVRTDLSPTLVKPHLYKTGAYTTTVSTSEHQRTSAPPPVMQAYWQVPAVPLLVPVTYEVKEESKSNVEYERKSRRYDDFGDDRKGSTLIRVEDEYSRRPKPKSIMKQIQKEFAAEDSWSDRRSGSPAYKYESAHTIGPRGYETSNTVEESKKTEEVERRVRSSSDKRRGGRHRHREAYDYEPNYVGAGRNIPIGPAPPAWRDSPNRSYRNEYTGRSRDDYYAEQDRRPQRGGNFHKTYSSRDVYGPEEDFYSYGSIRTGGGDRGGPIVEFPPTLPRSEAAYSERSVHRRRRDGPPPPDWHVEPYFYRDAWHLDKHNGDLTGLERDFRETSMAPLPHGQNVNEREFREEKIPGGQESYSREVKAQAGTRNNTQFSESKQEVHFKREQASDDRYPY